MLCVAGNLMVILVVTFSHRLRSITNFFLANLAVADFCVGIFCVYQNISIYLVSSWMLGDTLCKMYQFVHSLSYTASIFILVVICTERYFAIIHPITCKQILTPRRLVMVMVVVWVASALYSFPRFIWVGTVTTNLSNGMTETICITQRRKYDSKLFDIINFSVLYVAPLAVMMVLYSLIAVTLWHSSWGLERHYLTNGTSSPLSQTSRGDGPSLKIRFQKRPVSGSQVTINRISSACGGSGSAVFRSKSSPGSSLISESYHTSSSQKVLRARRGVIRMLIVVVLTFAICNLPYHARKMWQYWSHDYDGGSTFSSLFTPLTFLVAYFNSGINPLLYAFMSRNFRKGMRELLCCSIRGGGRGRGSQRHQTSSLMRRSSTRTTTKALSVTANPDS
ncbi:trissin receptor [Cryptotermes secundus]|uniref:trissin receptor n=1 Tax=Cryptotermes secundus TaxID=105785 RepID=UPI000CD7C1E5|nr:trissin receptor [Cryptotermes secundus]